MCGVAGVIAPLASPAWRREVLTRIIANSARRGTDAAGIAFVDPKAGLTVIKQGVAVDKFIETTEYKQGTKNLPAIVIGHTRAATGGPTADSSNNENNHPFWGKESGIAMVHNGMVQDEKWRKTVGRPKGIKTEFMGKTDSEVILRMTETMLLDTPANKKPNMLDAISDALFNIAGSYALEFVKKDEPNKIWFAAHNNPIVFGYNPKEHYIVVGSTKDILTESMGEGFSYLDYFYTEKLPPLIFNDMENDTLVEITISKEAPYFSIEPRSFKPNPTGYSYGGHGRRYGV